MIVTCIWVWSYAQQQLLALPASAYDDDRAAWAIVRAQTYQLGGNSAQARIYADSAQLVYAEQLRAIPANAQQHVLRGLALAYVGRRAEAIAEGERGAALVPISRDAFLGAYFKHQLVRIYLLVGEPQKALDRLEPLLKTPYYLSPGWLKIDPRSRPANAMHAFLWKSGVMTDLGTLVVARVGPRASTREGKWWASAIPRWRRPTPSSGRRV